MAIRHEMDTSDSNTFAAQFIHPAYKILTAFMSPLNFSKLMLIFHRFQQHDNRPEQSRILAGVIIESLKTRY